jgi:hypothetical protein
MYRRIVALLPIMLGLAFSTGTLTSISLHPAYADECISKPTGKAPQGYHWYYYTVDDHRCWILRSAEDLALMSDVTHEDVQDVEADTPAESPWHLPPMATKPVPAKPAPQTARRAPLAGSGSTPARSRFPVASDTSTASTNEPLIQAAANVPPAAFIVRWPSDFSPPGAAELTQVASAEQTPGTPDLRVATEASKPAAQDLPVAQAQTLKPAKEAKSLALDAAPIAAGILPLEALSPYFKLQSEHGAAIMTATLSLLTIALGVAIASLRTRRKRAIPDRQIPDQQDHWAAKAAPVLVAEATPPQSVHVLDAPPMFHEPVVQERTLHEAPSPQPNGQEVTRAFENTVLRLLRELQARRADRTTRVVRVLAGSRPAPPSSPDEYGLRRV